MWCGDFFVLLSTNAGHHFGHIQILFIGFELTVQETHAQKGMVFNLSCFEN